MSKYNAVKFISKQIVLVHIIYTDIYYVRHFICYEKYNIARKRLDFATLQLQNLIKIFFKKKVFRKLFASHFFHFSLQYISQSTNLSLLDSLLF